MSQRDLVTQHAMILWLERYERRDLTPERAAYERMHGAAPCDKDLLDFLGSHCGLDVAALAASMLTDNVRLALRERACAVRRGRVRLIIEGGRVVSVVPRRITRVMRGRDIGRHSPSTYVMEGL